MDRPLLLPRLLDEAHIKSSSPPAEFLRTRRNEKEREGMKRATEQN
jgi:hypothetical protein